LAFFFHQEGALDITLVWKPFRAFSLDPSFLLMVLIFGGNPVPKNLSGSFLFTFFFFNYGLGDTCVPGNQIRGTRVPIFFCAGVSPGKNSRAGWFPILRGFPVGIFFGPFFFPYLFLLHFRGLGLWVLDARFF